MFSHVCDAVNVGRLRCSLQNSSLHLLALLQGCGEIKLRPIIGHFGLGYIASLDRPRPGLLYEFESRLLFN